MKFVSPTILGFLVHLLATSNVQAHADDMKLPVHEFSTACSYYIDENGVPLAAENETLRLNLKSSIADFVKFAKEHQGQAVYVEISIEASNSAGWCMMFDDNLADDLPSDKSPASLHRSFGLKKIVGGESGQEQSYRLWARTSELNAGTMSVILPYPSSIPLDGLFVTQRFGDKYYFSGPVIMRFHEGNGFEAAVLQPLGNSQIFWKEIANIAR